MCTFNFLFNLVTISRSASLQKCNDYSRKYGLALGGKKCFMLLLKKRKCPLDFRDKRFASYEA